MPVTFPASRYVELDDFISLPTAPFPEHMANSQVERIQTVIEKSRSTLRDLDAVEQLSR